MSRKKKLWFKVIFAVVGAICGLVYSGIIDCSTIIFPIKLAWYLSTFVGLAVGYILADLLGGFISRRAGENE